MFVYSLFFFVCAIVRFVCLCACFLACSCVFLFICPGSFLEGLGLRGGGGGLVAYEV